MLRLAKQVLVAVLFIIAAGCGGGGCSSGCSCAAITPLANGFPTAQRIENAASVRLTDTGLDFLEQNLGTLAGQLLGGGGDGGVLPFEIGTQSGSFGPLKYEVCKDGPKPDANPPECVAEIDLGNAKLALAPAAPHNLKITGPMPIRLRNLPLFIQYFCVPLLGCVESNLALTLTGNDGCPGGDQPFANIDLDVNVSIEIDTDPSHARHGYSRVKVDVGLDESKLLDSLRVCGNFDAAILGFILDLAGDLIVGPLIDTLKGQIDEQLCQKANPELNPTCPAGTQDVDGTCRYGTDSGAECASILLGTEGNVDLGASLAGISPGARAAFDFLLAAGGHSERDDMSGFAWGDLNPVNNGATLGLYGGSEATPVSKCVPFAQLELPTGVPIPDELTSNSVPDWPMKLAGPHFGLALSERYANYLLAQIYNSGGLCLGITADALGDSVPLSTSIIALGLGANSMNELGRQKQPTSLAFLLRPQHAPTIEFGNGTDIEKDPSLRIGLVGVAIDFYVWSLDRYVRAFSVNMDIDVPANLVVTPEGLQPVIKKLGISNTTLTNATLLREDPAKVASALEGLVGDMVGGLLGGAISPIDLNSSLATTGLTLDIPESVDGKGSPGLRKLTKGSDDFLGIFATLGLASAAPMMQSETKASVHSLDVDSEGLRIATITPHNGPRATLELGSSLDDGSRSVEWQYKIDRGPWRPFVRTRRLVIEEPTLRNQGKHRVYVRSRVVGEPMSLDPEPEELELIVDDMAPEVRVSEPEDGRVRVDAADFVSRTDRVQVRVRFGDGTDASDGSFGPWSEWMASSELAAFDSGNATLVGIEAKDEAENVAQVTHALIRGDSAAAGCQCSVEQPKGSAGGLALGLGSLLFASLFGLRRGARPKSRRPIAQANVTQRPRRAGAKSGGRLATLAASSLFVLAAGSVPGCSCSEEVSIPNDCRHRGDCLVVTPGLVGAYTSAAVSDAGDIWVAGYLEANWDPNVNLSFGDLVVGKVDGDRVEWKVVDGTDPEEVVDAQSYDVQGFREGKTESGDDVGMWTSIAIGADGQPAVAYYDASNHALKFAAASGQGWRVTTVVAGTGGADHGRYAKLHLLGGKPTIAYHFIERQGGKVASGVRVAVGADAAGSSFSIEDVVVDATTPCTAELCESGTACLTDGTCVKKSGDCADECPSGEACVVDGGSGACKAAKAAGATITYPAEVGLYVSSAPRPDGSLAIAYYDRVHGNLAVATKTGSAWSSAIVDGQDAQGNDTGDKGIAASLAIDEGGNFHIGYVDGLAETLSYAFMAGGAGAPTLEVVDDGLGDGDGHHIVGDDAHVLVTQSGVVRMSYQDATAGTLKVAVGEPSGNAHTWTSSAAAQEGFAGFFTRQLVHQGALKVVNWWRVAGPLPVGDVAIVTSPDPSSGPQ